MATPRENSRGAEDGLPDAVKLLKLIARFDAGGGSVRPGD